MRIGLAQVKPVKGAIENNIGGHTRWIELAVSNRADVIIFPELSLTGYEPSLAQALAIHPHDNRLAIFQQLSDANDMVIGVGAPTIDNRGTCISMIIFRPLQDRLIYSKKYLHPDEEAYFVPGHQFPVMEVKGTTLALAICYELSIDEHAQLAFSSGADIYLASVAKSAQGVAAAHNRLSALSASNARPVLMVNSIGPTTDFACAGKTAAWNNHGRLMDQLSNSEEGILIFDTDTQAILKFTL